MKSLKNTNISSLYVRRKCHSCLITAVSVPNWSLSLRLCLPHHTQPSDQQPVELTQPRSLWAGERWHIKTFHDGQKVHTATGESGRLISKQASFCEMKESQAEVKSFCQKKAVTKNNSYSPEKGLFMHLWRSSWCLDENGPDFSI